ncbi:hypothetical protein B7463_g2310, partial [Scytalidium lignicola]
MKFPLELPATADFHVHLRDGAMMETVVPTIEQGGVDTVYVMPNLVPPITTVAHALAYKEKLKKLTSNVNFLMTLYLHPTITPEVIEEAAKAGIGISYPSGVTTNSSEGVLEYSQFYPVFAAMQKHGLILNLHGEVPSTPAAEYTTTGDSEPITILNAEERFLPTLKKIHADFPDLNIVLEHCTTKAALDTVRGLGPNVAATITAHHLWICLDEAVGSVHNFCKPVAKSPLDRVALVKAVVSGEQKFFFGSDSAPHPLSAKVGGLKTVAGCFTQSYATSLVVSAVQEAINKGWIKEEDVTQEKLEGFLSTYGRRFYKLPEAKEGKRIVLEKKGEVIKERVVSRDGEVKVVNFKSGDEALSSSTAASLPFAIAASTLVPSAGWKRYCGATVPATDGVWTDSYTASCSCRVPTLPIRVLRTADLAASTLLLSIIDFGDF